MGSSGNHAVELARVTSLRRRTVLQAGFTGAGLAVAAPFLSVAGANAGGSRLLASRPLAQTAATAPTAGGELIVGVKAKYIDVLDPNVTAQTVAHEVMMPIFDTLVYQDRDGAFWPGLATAWEVSPDGRAYTFTLQGAARFHDGTPFDAAAVKFNLDRMSAPDSKSRLAGPRLSGFYASSEVLDPQTVRITFTQPNGAFLTDLSQNFMAMLSPAAVAEYGPNEIGRHPIGTGPFRFVEWIENVQIRVERNADYAWASPMFNHQGPAHLDGITFRIIPEDGARMAALEAGELNFVDQVPTLDFARIQEDSNYTTYSIPQPGIPFAYMLNTKRPPTDELAVRQAINHAIDKQAIIDTLYQGLYTPAFGPLSPTTFGYNAEVEGMYPYDPDQAKRLLDEAGWTAGPDGIRVKDGKPLEINHYVFTDTKVAEVMQAQLQTIGIRSNVTLLEVGAVNEAATRGEETNLAPLPFRDADPAVLCIALCTKNEGKGFAWTFHKHPELDQELELGQAATDPAERLPHYARAQVIAMTEALLLPVYNINGLSASTADVQDVAFDVKGVDPWVYDVWLQEE